MIMARKRENMETVEAREKENEKLIGKSIEKERMCIKLSNIN